MEWRGILASIVAVVVLSGCAAPPSGARNEGYYLQFPSTISAADGPNGGATVDVETNLPPGTFASVEYSEVGGPSGGGSRCCPETRDGVMPVIVNDNSCYAEKGTPPSTGFRITVTVVPDTGPLAFECLDPDGCSHPQPQSVQDVLGPQFERLHGDQVTTVEGMRALVASTSYDWPDDVCAAHYASDGFMPASCPSNYADYSAETAEAAAGTLIGPFGQYRLCELYDDGSAEFRATHPWPEFRDRVKAWLDSFGAFYDDQGHQLWEARVVSTSDETFVGFQGATLPEHLVADYYYRDQRVAEAEIAHTRGGGERVVPQWEFTRFDLLSR